jgi:hypothetical protein
MPQWIHDRAEHLLAKNPKMEKSTAFAIATQQSHRLGKSPKGYGTKKGKQEAKAKYSKPKKEYKKTPNPGKLDSPKMPGKPKEASAFFSEFSAIMKVANGDEEGMRTELTAEDKKAIKSYMKDRPKGEADKEFHALVEERHINPHAAEEHVYDMLGEKTAAAFLDELTKIGAEHKDKTPGGKADKKQLSDYPKDQIAMGQKVEMEHTDDPALAREISMDHLEEFPDYYTRLKRMEHEAEKAKEKTAKVLTQKGREQIKTKNFAIPKGNGPGDTGKYPIHDERHAKSALTYVEQHGTPSEKAQVYKAVAKKYPGLSRESSVPELRERVKEKKASSLGFGSEFLVRLAFLGGGDGEDGADRMEAQVGRPKTKLVSSASPNPKFRIKQAQIPTAPAPMGSTLPDVQSKLKKTQRIGTPDDPNMGIKPLNALKPPKTASVDVARSLFAKLAFTESQFSGGTGYGRFRQTSMVQPIGAGVAPASIMDPKLSGSKPTELKEKRAFTASGFGPTSSHGAWSGNGGYDASNPQPIGAGVPSASIMDPKLSGSRPMNLKRAAMVKEGAPPTTTPQGRLAQASKVGAPKKTGFSGPSIAEQYKPVGFGIPMPGAKKNKI